MAIFKRKRHSPTVEAMRIKNTDWLVPYNRGCWLVEDESGNQQVLSDTQFNERYERV